MSQSTSSSHSPNPPAPDSRGRSVAKQAFLARAAAVLWKVVLIGCVLAGIAWAVNVWKKPGAADADEITANVVRANLLVTVTERGELESSNKTDVRCEVEGHQNKIVEILDEGTRVKEGDVVVRFDEDELSRSYAEQEIKVKQAQTKAKTAGDDLEVQKAKEQSEIDKKKLAFELAVLDREKYLEGDYLVELEDMKGAISLAEKEYQEAVDKLEHFRKFVRKGFGTPTQLRLRQRDVERLEFHLGRDRAKLKVLEEYTRKRQEVELNANALDAEREWGRTIKSQAALTTKAKTDWESSQVTADLEERQLEQLEKQLKNCTIRAPQDGILVYSKERYWDPNARIQVGAMVHFQQTIFSLPDLSKMQVKVKIHESSVKKVAVGQKAEIRVDAYTERVLHGTVEQVATIADSRGYWNETGGVKEYVTIVQIDDLPEEAGLRPGMTAEVRVFIDELADVLIVPVQAIAERENQHYSYVRGNAGFERRKVSIGENNDAFVEIRQGLGEGDPVALDARARLTAETENETNANSAGEKALASAIEN